MAMAWHMLYMHIQVFIMKNTTNEKKILLAIIIVFEFPPRLSLRSHVKTESLYGMNVFFFLVFVDNSAKDE